MEEYRPLAGEGKRENLGDRGGLRMSGLEFRGVAIFSYWDLETAGC
jgi:hypothetical protein